MEAGVVHLKKAMIKEELSDEIEPEGSVKLEAEEEDDDSPASDSGLTPISQQGRRVFYDDQCYEYRFCNAIRDAHNVGRRDIAIRCTERHCKGKAYCLRSEEIIQKNAHDPPHAPPFGKKERREAIGLLKLERLNGVAAEDAVRKIIVSLPSAILPSRSALRRMAHRVHPADNHTVGVSGTMDTTIKKVLSRTNGMAGTGNDQHASVEITEHSMGNSPHSESASKLTEHKELPGDEKKAPCSIINRKIISRPIVMSQTSSSNGEVLLNRKLSIVRSPQSIRAIPYQREDFRRTVTAKPVSIGNPRADALAELVRHQADFLIRNKMESKFNELWSGIIECVDKSNK
ncbi:unnamed protein product [Caenorhabditis auriculariae]|uniref:Uncharacterized protein n=1 Tax=Caenorhabditis auriculariae TaxID=2777116 RepID=A0A8S1GN07_9PELO|nr:unnamed protein product [Caenorhabditis auriculariae]